MKKIKKIEYLLLIFFVSLLFGCQDLNKEPFEINIEDGPFGSFVRLDITTSPVLDVTDIDNSNFGGTLSAPSNNVASWSVNVRRVSGGEVSDFFPLATITTFPSEFIANAANISAALGLTVADLLPGDRFDFEATSIGTNGEVVTFDDFSTDLQGNPGQAQGYRFNTFISCPFVQGDALGTYVVTTSGFNTFPAGNTFEVIAGANSGQIIMVNPHGSPDPDGVGYEITVDVSPFGIATLEDDQFIFDTDATGNAGFTDTFINNGSGFVFSCAGSIVLSMDL